LVILKIFMQSLFIDSTQLSRSDAQLVSDGPIMVMPCTDRELAERAVALACSRARSEGLLVAVLDTQRLGFVGVLNQAFKVSRSPWLGYMAQDAFAGRDWMALALKAMQAGSGGLLGFNDGKWHGELASFGLASRDWVKGVYGGDFFFQGYRSHFADAELTLVARQQGRYVYAPESVLVEVDWAKDQAGVNPADRSMFRARAKQGFGQRVTDANLINLIR
jgi:hypothetical protein